MSGRIPRTFIDELLTRTDIVTVIEQYITLKKAGANYQALCPFHNEKSPSFSVSQSKQFYHCFGCRANGNAIGFLMEFDHMSFVDAIETLASQAGLEVPYETESGENFKPKEDSTSLYDLMEKAKKYYQSALKQNQRALDYLKSRGLSEEIIQNTGIGYSPDAWDELLNKFGKNPEARKNLLDAGMLIQKSENKFYDRFRHRIMFPIHDRRGRVIGFGGRVLDDSTPKYLNSPETPIFHKGSELYGLYEARKQNRNLDRLLVVEGYMDVIGLAQHDVTYAVATLGTATTTQHIQQLFRICSEIVFCFDGDQAGQSAAWRALETLLPNTKDNWQAKFMFLPNGEDPDSMIQKEGKDQFEKQIKEAESLSTFFFRQLMTKVDMQNLDGRARFASLAMPYIQKIQADFLRDMLLNELAKLTRIKIEKLNTHLPQPKTEKTSLQKILQKNKISLIRTAITLLIQHPKLINQLQEDIPQLDAPGMPLLHELIQVITKRLTAKDSESALTTGTLLEYWRDKTEGRQLATLASQELLIPIEGLDKEFCGTIQAIKLQANQENIKQLISQAASGTLTNQEKELLQKLLKEKNI